MTENGDRNGRVEGSWRIVIADPALQTASVGQVIERASFDPKWALDDPDVTLLDVGHPLVRRLVEEVKQNAFRAGLTREDRAHYGRTTYTVTPDVDEVMALFQLLVRYVVNTDPTSIVEELLPVGIPVYSDQQPVNGGETVQRLLQPRRSSQMRTEAEVQETLTDALAIEGLDERLERVVETRRRELVTERRGMREQMEQREGARAAEWLAGIDDLLPGSFDLLALTVLLPA